ncbi:MAG TPA: hypothetical protein VFY29_14015, partial [Terriglobia bacterium]|nr:hypothetical protein [Terriglobia bacterium]
MAVLLAAAGATFVAAAQTPIAVRYTATTDNVGMRDSIRVELFRWSTDQERQELLAAWNVAAPPAPTP